MLAQEVIRRKRDGAALEPAEIGAFVDGLTTDAWSEGQVAALAMAIVWRGMTAAETVSLTQAMVRSGQVLHWDAQALGGPVLDKHSTGGVGDKVSLMLAPIVAACGGFVPMVSGRGLGHTGGTLDKLASIPGYDVAPPVDRLRQVVGQVGCAIIGQTADLAPADRRLYAVRDVTATVESVPLITASILSKKLAAGLHGLVMDVKLGNGAFAAKPAFARALAQSIVDVAGGAGLPTRALITDMNSVLGRRVGNALEVREAIEFLTGHAVQGPAREPRLLEATRELSAELLCIGGLAVDLDAARGRVDRVLASGAAAERFARMVHALGGPVDLIDRPDAHLPAAPVILPVPAPRDGVVTDMATRDIGLALIELGGGRRLASDAIDPRVGFAHVLPMGSSVRAGEPLAWVHAADAVRAASAIRTLCHCISIGDRPPPETMVVLARLPGD